MISAVGGQPPFLVFLDSQIRRIRQGLDDRERRVAGAVSLGDSGIRPERRRGHLGAKSPAPRRILRVRASKPAPVVEDATPPLRAKQLRRCACGCGLFALITSTHGPAAAVFIEGHASGQNPKQRCGPRKIGALAAAARQEQSA
jgi:hypothetical protein